MAATTIRQGLPDDEKKFWHSHVNEVLSGQQVAPGVPLAAANLDAKSLLDTCERWRWPAAGDL